MEEVDAADEVSIVQPYLAAKLARLVVVVAEPVVKIQACMSLRSVAKL